ncbi:hypothetical protein M422DRAFT_34933 [Sphaerobolus stellatus SS14]|uniref:Uncharacterized protein n=1 Tax=Sphaerobolus stellatus (strain SS14) TaxID=990650 RepID=A0A0C9TWQ4_SPHS4|nr:hypothetical protein M422DRAFT_34933 [Sphaerobolus stellatus SS14]
MGCASNREYSWYLGLGPWDKGNQEGNVSAYNWIPGKGCDTYEKVDRESLIMQLVEDGGWLILGDSVSEGHFHSLSCMLYPHVYATPDYIKNPYWDRAWPQYLYLNKSSSLVPHINFPKGFDIDKTPLVLFRRVDLLLGKADLTSLWKDFPAGNATGKDLFEGGDDVWDLDPSVCVPIFLAPLPEANFRTMIFNTAGHWTVGTLPGFEASGLGYTQMLEFFSLSMDSWIRSMVDMLEHAKEDDEANGIKRKRERQIVVRGYNPGHDACNLAQNRLGGPLEEWNEGWTHSWNWKWIRKFNGIFENLIQTWNHPNIHYLPLEKIGLLRPDVHVLGDCLHILTGGGVIESWSEYISYFMRHLP